MEGWTGQARQGQGTEASGSSTLETPSRNKMGRSGYTPCYAMPCHAMPCFAQEQAELQTTLRGAAGAAWCNAAVIHFQPTTNEPWAVAGRGSRTSSSVLQASRRRTLVRLFTSLLSLLGAGILNLGSDDGTLPYYATILAPPTTSTHGVRRSLAKHPTPGSPAREMDRMEEEITNNSRSFPNREMQVKRHMGGTKIRLER
ncbi:hypothetical protein CPLU01_04504 [Colletotrichum plurivorum]|uniref:Uncharacterized protein n=1 Tax=Colletotrichum plurivorum TaxID=2175906 RepID=A0A8H6KPF3_9PEZI|nr:hypothetical protein CPLU01_04504 [Colletotrichum plurivorum]